MRRSSFFHLALLGALFVSGGARAAEPRDVQAADALFRSAKEAMDRGDLAAACPRFIESQRLDPAVGTLLNLGECELRSGKLVSAAARFRAARAELPATDPRIPFTEQRIKDLARRTPRLRLVGSGAPGTGVRCDGVDLAPAELAAPLQLDPGAHACDVRAPGHVDARIEIALREEEERSVDVPVGALVVSDPAPQPVPAARPKPSTPMPVAPAAPQDGSAQRVLGLVVGGAGIASLGVGALLGLLAKGTYDNALSNCAGGLAACNEEGVRGVSRAHTQATAATLAFAAGGVLLAGGAVLYLTAPRSAPVAVTPSVGAGTAGLSLHGVF